MAIELDAQRGVLYATWTTAQRPTSPQTGLTGYNTSLNMLETYNGTAWILLGPKTDKSIVMSVVFGV